MGGLSGSSATQCGPPRSRRAGLPLPRAASWSDDPALVEKATSLSVDERLELIAKVWDSIDHSTRPVSPSVAAIIEERVAGAEANPWTAGPGMTFVRVFASVTAVEVFVHVRATVEREIEGSSTNTPSRPCTG